MIKKQGVLFLVLIMCNIIYAQVSFDKGYYITNINEKVECLIKNKDWKNNPTEFVYKLAENEKPERTTINLVKEFAVYNSFKFIRAIVDIDRATKNLSIVNHNKQPIFKEETLFLKVLLEGEANLYYYEDGNYKKFFFKKTNPKIEQLVYRTYRTSKRRLGKNNYFKQQLLNNFKCASVTKERVERIDYYKKDLINLFTEFNACKKGTSINFSKKQSKQKVFNLSIRPRFNFSSLALMTPTRDLNFENKSTFGLGVELESVLSFNKNKWALFIEPAYQNYKSEAISIRASLPANNEILKVNYNSFIAGLGLRHYLFLNDKLKLFINCTYLLNLISNSSIDTIREFDQFVFRSIRIRPLSNVAFGVGGNFKGKHMLELRYSIGASL